MAKSFGRSRRPPLRVIGLALSIAGFAAHDLGCSDSAEPQEPPPLRDCPRALWARASHPGAAIHVIGSWDGWKEPGTAMPLRSDGWYTTRIAVPEGEYGYMVVENGQKRLDVFTALTTFNADEEVSLLRVPACEMPEIKVDEVRTPATPTRDSLATATVRATFLRGQSGARLSPASVTIVPDRTGAATAAPLTSHIETADAATGALDIVVTGLPRGNNVVRLVAADEAGRRTEQRVSIWIDPRAKTNADGVIYEIFVDRFRSSDGKALTAPSSPAQRAGGTLDGVRAELEKGTFEALGVTALWLTPPTITPDEPRIGRSGRLEEAYHGYWQLDTRVVDPRLGGDDALDRLVEAAHRRGMRILIDIVPNHIYEKHPRYLLHQSDGWFHEGTDKCVCGDDACSWATDIEHCWFTAYLPDYRFQNAEVMRGAAEDAAYWMTRFHVDGVRVDAVPMMPRAATRRIVDALRGAVAPSTAGFSVGEVFTGTDGLDTIRQYLGEGGLSSAFDFPLMWAMRDAVAADVAGFTDVEGVLARNEAAIAGSSNVFARMLDNHDTSRFLSDAAGDGERDAWDDPPSDPDSDVPYRRLELGLALLFTMPGIPVIYYGDEVAIAGASDPDSRRVMPDLSSLAPWQANVLAVARKLGTLRTEVEALRSGAQRTLFVDRDRYAFSRASAGGSLAATLASKSRASTSITLDPGAMPSGRYIDALTNELFSVEATVPTSIPMAPLSFRVLLPFAAR
jgi:glycosidase